MWRRGFGDAPPGPFPSRVEAFLSACALHAGQRESDLINLAKSFAGEAEKAASRGR